MPPISKTSMSAHFAEVASSMVWTWQERMEAVLDYLEQCEEDYRVPDSANFRDFLEARAEAQVEAGRVPPTREAASAPAPAVFADYDKDLEDD